MPQKPRLVIEPMSVPPNQPITARRLFNPAQIVHAVEVTNTLTGDMTVQVHVTSGQDLQMSAEGWKQVLAYFAITPDPIPVDDLWYREWGDEPPDPPLTDESE